MVQSNLEPSRGMRNLKPIWRKLEVWKFAKRVGLLKTEKQKNLRHSYNLRCSSDQIKLIIRSVWQKQDFCADVGKVERQIQVK
jgi:hypothetical protein